MIPEEKILKLARPVLDANDIFIVGLQVSSSNRITVHIDSMKGVTIDECVKMSRAIEQGLDRDEEDFELEVSSAGLDSPFNVHEQYIKNVGREISVQLPDGRKETGKLIEVNNEGFTIEKSKRARIEGKKKKQLIIEQTKFRYSETNKVKLEIKFK